MLKRFLVQNFTSFKKITTLDLTAGRVESHPDHVVDFKNVKILKSAIIYGTNASGKSNLIKAIHLAKNIILKGIENVDTFKKHHRLLKTYSTKDSNFQFDIEIDDNFYAYGFSCRFDKKTITSEWLYEINKGTKKIIFERSKGSISLGPTLTKSQVTKKRMDIYQDDMKNQPDELFLSQIANKNLDIEQLQIFNKIYQWFDEDLMVLFPGSNFLGKFSDSGQNNILKLYEKYLYNFDTGIYGIKAIEKDFDDCLNDMPREVRKDLKESMIKGKQNSAAFFDQSTKTLYNILKTPSDEIKIQQLGFQHSEKSNDFFEAKDESDGTKRLLDLIPLINELKFSPTIIVDEFDRSLHPNLTLKFFQLFFKHTDANNLKAQIIATTHETTLLNNNLVRRDEIWRMNKELDGESTLKNFNNFKIRSDTKLDKAYLMGKFEGTPSFKKSPNYDF